MYAKVKDLNFPVKECSAGVPQEGSIFRSFLIYINDFPKLKNLHVSLYADDTALYILNRTELTPYVMVSQLELVSFPIIFSNGKLK